MLCNKCCVCWFFRCTFIIRASKSTGAQELAPMKKSQTAENIENNISNTLEKEKWGLRMLILVLKYDLSQWTSAVSTPGTLNRDFASKNHQFRASQQAVEYLRKCLHLSWCSKTAFFPCPGIYLGRFNFCTRYMFADTPLLPTWMSAAWDLIYVHRFSHNIQ